MPIDDLDQLLAMELGGAPEPRKTSQQVSSLEAQVLSRIQQTREPPETTDQSINNQPINNQLNQQSETISSLDPVLQFADALTPILLELQTLLSIAEAAETTTRLALRTRLAEQLLALPELTSLDKPALFAALAVCLDAAGSVEAEARRAAQVRVKKLLLALNTAQRNAAQQRLQCLADLCQSLPN